MMVKEEIQRALEPIQRVPRDEKELQEWMAQLFEWAEIDFRREVETGSGPVDFVIGSTIVEVKIAGSAIEVGRQIARYLQAPEFTGAVLVTTRPMRMPFGVVQVEGCPDKPILVLELWRQFL